MSLSKIFVNTHDSGFNGIPVQELGESEISVPSQKLLTVSSISETCYDVSANHTHQITDPDTGETTESNEFTLSEAWNILPTYVRVSCLRFCFINSSTHKKEFYFNFSNTSNVRGPFLLEKILSNGLDSEIKRADIFINKYHPTYIPNSFVHTRGHWEYAEGSRIALVPVKSSTRYYLWLNGTSYSSSSMGAILLLSKGSTTILDQSSLEMKDSCYIINTDVDTELIAFTEKLLITKFDVSGRVMLFDNEADITQSYISPDKLKIENQILDQVQQELANIDTTHLVLEDEDKQPVQLNGTLQDVSPTFDWSTGVLSGTRLHQESLSYFVFAGLPNIECENIRVNQTYWVIPVIIEDIKAYISIGWTSSEPYNIAIHCYNSAGEKIGNNILNQQELIEFIKSLIEDYQESYTPDNLTLEISRHEDIHKVILTVFSRSNLSTPISSITLSLGGILNLFPVCLITYAAAGIYLSTFLNFKVKNFE